MRIFAAAIVCLFLVGCTDENGPTPTTKLPPVPADLQKCFRESGVVVSDRDLTVADVESLWKIDRFRIVVMRKCGQRLIAWYDELRVNWR